MQLQISEILSPSQAAAMANSLSASPDFQSGKSTAGWNVRDIKHNEQNTGPAAQTAIGEVQQTLLKHPVFMSAARPKEFVKLLVSRYQPGMAYGRHVDDAIMAGRRTDLSFTLFLSPPEAYEGGELVIEGLDAETDVKLPAGSLVLYPTNALHRVNEITKGQRLVIVGWIRSYIRSPEHRETLFELDQIISAMNTPDRALSDKIFKLRNTLTRMWAED
jgi:PKHD-type hydroxylase